MQFENIFRVSTWTKSEFSKAIKIACDVGNHKKMHKQWVVINLAKFLYQKEKDNHPYSYFVREKLYKSFSPPSLLYSFMWIWRKKMDST